jgi:Caspase domain
LTEQTGVLRAIDGHAVVVGISTYRSVRPLPASVVKDASDVAAVLSDPALCGYPPQNVELLINEQATSSAILQALQRLADRTDYSSAITIYFSGHGLTIAEEENRGWYLLAVDTNTDSHSKVAASAISHQQMTEAIKNLPAKQVLVIFDACHSAGFGSIKSAMESSASVPSGLPESAYEQLVTGKGRVISPLHATPSPRMYLATPRTVFSRLTFLLDSPGACPAAMGWYEYSTFLTMCNPG